MDCHRDHGQPRASDGKSPVSLSVLELDMTDQIFLTIARHLFRDQASERQEAGRMAVTIAELSFGHGRGTAIAAAVEQAIDVLRLCRRDEFSYRNPDCPRCSGFVTEAEALFIQVFRSLRMGRISTAAANALLLCEGNDYARFLDAVSDVFGIVFGSRWQSETETWLTDRPCRP